MPEFAKFQCENAGKNFALFALFCAYREHAPTTGYFHVKTKISKKNPRVDYYLLLNYLYAKAKL